MLRKLFSIFGRSVSPASAPAQRYERSLTEFQNGVYEALPGHEDIMSDYVFIATLHPRTSLKVLRQHGARCSSLPTTDQRTASRDGVWLPMSKSWNELGLASLRELPASTMASAVGPVPENGGAFLPFLVAFRTAIEAGGPPDEVAARAWAAVQATTERREIASRLEWTGPESLDDYVGYPEALGTPALSVKVAKSLYLAGFRSRSALDHASDVELRSVKGVGPKRLKEIRAALT